jgi:predicted nuclease of predicted toxin-antitoxin system
VVAVIEDSRGALDREVFARSRREHRVLLTEDKDFGQLAVASDLAGRKVLSSSAARNSHAANFRRRLSRSLRPQVIVCLERS